MSLFDLFRKHDLEVDWLHPEPQQPAHPKAAPKNWPDVGEPIWHSDDRWRWEPGIPFVIPGVVTGIVSDDWVEVLSLDGPHGGEHLIVPRYSLEHRHTKVVRDFARVGHIRSARHNPQS
jgi:hypothetical protein